MKNTDITEEQRMRLAEATALLTDRVRQQLAIPEFFGRVTIDLFIQKNQVTGLEVNVKETIRLHPL